MEGSFNAARGFVGGAAVNEKFSPKNFRCFNAARGFVGGAALFLVLYHHQQLVSMPHAALWVVQPLSGTIGNFKEARFQCRTRLCGWCSNGGSFAVQHCRWFQCRTRLCGWCSRMNSTAVDVMATFQCRTRLCGWCSKLGTVYLSGAIRFQCRTRLCGWCSLVTVSHSASTSLVSMPHAALWVVQHCHREGLRRPYVFQCRTRLCGWCSAAGCCSSLCSRSFNAARGFVGGAAQFKESRQENPVCFNAARGFVGGAASSLSVLVPLRGKRPFGKSPEI